MTLPAAVLCCLVSADVRPQSEVDPPAKLRLVLTPNANKILQHDNLLVRVVLENPADSGIKDIEPPEEYNCYYFEVQLRDGAEWRRCVDVEENANGPWGQRGFRKPVEPGKRYAEYNWFHRNKSSYIFERAGKCELRAVAQLNGRELLSDPVTITVGERSLTDLPRLDRAPSRFTSVNWKIYDEWRALESLGGNIKNTIQNFALIQEYAQSGKLKGQEVTKKDMCAALQRHMDPVSWEYHLTLLGKHFVSKADVEAIGHVLRAAPAFDAREFRDLASNLATLRQQRSNPGGPASTPQSCPEQAPK
ncbi:MAG: hypothetical protein L0211_13420 [Planctomycetaceae bacterium]|nr:hypothetical protein [Planctomycetaceae bacterium]